MFLALLAFQPQLDTPVLLRRKVDLPMEHRFFVSMNMSFKMEGLPQEAMDAMGKMNGSKFGMTSAVTQRLTPAGNGKAKVTLQSSTLTVTGLEGMNVPSGAPKGAKPETTNAVIDDRNLPLSGNTLGSQFGDFAAWGIVYPEKAVRYGDTWKRDISFPNFQQPTTRKHRLSFQGFPDVPENHLASQGAAQTLMAMPGMKISMTFTYLGEQMVDGVLCRHIGVVASTDMGKLFGAMTQSSIQLDGMNNQQSNTMDAYMDAADGDIRDLTFSSFMGYQIGAGGQTIKTTMFMSGETKRVN